MILVSLCRAGTFTFPSSARFGKGKMCVFHDSGSFALKAPILLVWVFELLIKFLTSSSLPSIGGSGFFSKQKGKTRSKKCSDFH